MSPWARSPAPHKDFSDVYEELGVGEREALAAYPLAAHCVRIRGRVGSGSLNRPIGLEVIESAHEDCWLVVPGGVSCVRSVIRVPAATETA